MTALGSHRTAQAPLHLLLKLVSWEGKETDGRNLGAVHDRNAWVDGVNWMALKPLSDRTRKRVVDSAADIGGLDAG